MKLIQVNEDGMTIQLSRDDCHLLMRACEVAADDLPQAEVWASLFHLARQASEDAETAWLLDQDQSAAQHLRVGT